MEPVKCCDSEESKFGSSHLVCLNIKMAWWVEIGERWGKGLGNYLNYKEPQILLRVMSFFEYEDKPLKIFKQRSYIMVCVFDNFHSGDNGIHWKNKQK